MALVAECFNACYEPRQSILTVDDVAPAAEEMTAPSSQKNHGEEVVDCQSSSAQENSIPTTTTTTTTTAAVDIANISLLSALRELLLGSFVDGAYCNKSDDQGYGDTMCGVNGGDLFASICFPSMVSGFNYQSTSSSSCITSAATLGVGNGCSGVSISSRENREDEDDVLGRGRVATSASVSRRSSITSINKPHNNSNINNNLSRRRRPLAIAVGFDAMKDGAGRRVVITPTDGRTISPYQYRTTQNIKSRKQQQQQQQQQPSSVELGTTAKTAVVEETIATTMSKQMQKYDGDDDDHHDRKEEEIEKVDDFPPKDHVDALATTTVTSLDDER